MTNKYLGPGDKTEYTAPAGGVVQGLGYVIGANTFVIAEGTAAVGVTFVGCRRGRWRLPKNATEALTAGQRAYWDDTAKAVRNASAAGRFIIGVVEGAEIAAATFCDVVLDEHSVIVI